MGWALLALAAGMAVAAPEISIQQARLSFPGEGRLRVELAATARDVGIGSWGVRTVDRDAPPPARFVRRGAYAFLPFAEQTDPDWYMLVDNGRGDTDPSAGAVAFEMDVSDWPDGEHRLLVFACNRPAPGAYVDDKRVLRVVVETGRPVPQRTLFLSELSVRIERFSVAPARVSAGSPFVVRARARASQVEDVQFQLTVPYTVGPDEAPPGFHYVPEERMAYLADTAPYVIADNGASDEDPAPHALSVRVPTDGWRPGVWNLTLVAAAVEAPTDVKDYVDFAVTVAGESPRFEATLEGDQLLKAGTHFGCFGRLADGGVLADEWVTRDGGLTWVRLSGGTALPMPLQLRDGSLIGLGGRTAPIEGRKGTFRGNLYRSADLGQTVQGPVPCVVHVPRATGGVGHSEVQGPIFWRSIVEMPDGSLLATMYGWFEGDESPVPGQPGSFYYRTFVVRSADGGLSWEYVATVAYDPAIGTEGYCEPAMRLLPNGELVCLLRTGGNNRPFHQDNPLCVTWSSDGGHTWAQPIRTGFEGVAPDLAVMGDGTLACSTGRPGAWVLFSADNGRTWGDAVSIDAERYSGYTAIAEVEPGVLLVGYGAMQRRDPQTGKRDNELRTVRMRVRRVP